MRGIKFRGKSLDIGEEGKWLYGSLLISDETFYFILPFDFFTKGSEHITKYLVDPRTVGQYIGLKDKNGKEIYEGDIVILKERRSLFEGGEMKVSMGKVVWDESRARFTIISSSVDPFLLGEIEVIGNVYDNPELLKKNVEVIDNIYSDEE